MKFILLLLLLLVQEIVTNSYRKTSDDYYISDDVRDEVLKNIVENYVAEKIEDNLIMNVVNDYIPFEDEEDDYEDDDGETVMENIFNWLGDDAQNVRDHSPENINDDLRMKIPGEYSVDHIGDGDIMFRPGEEETVFEGGSGDVNGYADASTVFAKWPNPIPYVIDSSLGLKARSAIDAAIDEYKKKTCIRFTQRTNQPDFLFIHKGTGCWSYIGKSGGNQSLSLGSGCEYKKTVIHELMHALGFWHEQARPDRDDYVTINWDNIEDGRKDQFKKMKASEVNTFGHKYDYRSVMHYSKRAFGKNFVIKGWFFFKRKKILDERLETITPKANTDLGQCWDCGMSSIDAAQLNAMYC